MTRNVAGTILFLFLALLPLTSRGDSAYSLLKAERDLARLNSATTFDRGEWLRVIGRFVRLSRNGSDRHTRARSLLDAGTAFLELHRRSGHSADLEQALKYLDEFHRTARSRSGPARQAIPAGSAPVVRERGERPGSQGKAVAPVPRYHRRGTSGTAWGVPAGQSRFTVGGNASLSRQPTPRRSFAMLSRGNPFCPPGTRIFMGVPMPLEEDKATDPPAPEPVRQVSPVPARPQRPKPRAEASGFVIAIDPGHGGKDPGAVSSDGLVQEKNVVLEIARRLARKLVRRNPGIKVLLTRSDDRFLSLHKRAALANDAGADLFVSIHCNSSTESHTRGVETYYLSPASSRKALTVAKRENGSRSVKGAALHPASMDVSHLSKKDGSVRLAKAIHRALVRRIRIRTSRAKDRGIRRGPFNVLHIADMPAVLVEVAYMSNKADSRLLRSHAYLQRLAEGIGDGVEAYMRGCRPRTWLAREKRGIHTK